MKGRDLVSIADLTSEELWRILRVSRWLKTELRAGHRPPLLKDKVVALLFEKPSLRTRVSFDVGVTQLGGHCLYLSPSEVGLGTRERVKDVARVLSRYVDVLVARTFNHETVEALAQYSTCPVINGLSDKSHPCQALADVMTVWEHCGRLEGVKVGYLGDGNNVAHSLALAGALTGVNLWIATPPGRECSPAYLSKVQQIAVEHGSTVHFTNDPIAAATDADALYTDVWVSMGQESPTGNLNQLFGPYQLNERLRSLAKPDCIVMHDLPAHIGEEITEDVFESARSVVFDQAENRLHAQKGLLALIAGGDHPDLPR